MATRSGRLRRRRRLWEVGGEGGIDLAFELFEAEELGVEGLGVGLLAGRRPGGGRSRKSRRSARGSEETVKRIVAVTLPFSSNSRHGWQSRCRKRRLAVQCSGLAIAPPNVNCQALNVFEFAILWLPVNMDIASTSFPFLSA